mmetsp:Transcript_17128/g.39547  ORF Transcript_17128/g.39547 Transcript_17128/m.39547 type:complete len:113 (+) Transcript_17128:809-1147(+)
MIADFFTKPLQGTLFQKFRNMILGINKDMFNVYKKQYSTIVQYFPLINTNRGSMSGHECVGQIVDGKMNNRNTRHVEVKHELKRCSASNDKTPMTDVRKKCLTLIQFNSIRN